MTLQIKYEIPLTTTLLAYPKINKSGIILCYAL